MDSEFSDTSSEMEDNGAGSAKKRKKTGRMTDVMKVLRAESHELGPNCFCKRLQCFKNVSEDERKKILHDFNALGNNNKQNSYLAGLITILPVMRRRPRKSEHNARPNSASFAYRVCIKAFESKKKKVE
ncbi:hypothetical protein ABEB36_008325 [Hypothenemus hampei]|uniref:Uncharacterized protein n=1 Tax=Hypothenemus hampei TaxID=57062 RepID=A0ABD1ELI9_HYPHA